MNILFHEQNFSLGGTTRALLDYAEANEKYLNNKSFIAFNRKYEESAHEESLNELLEDTNQRFVTIKYDYEAGLENFIGKHGIDAIYTIKSGEPGGFVSARAKNLMHAVFPQNPNNFHGDRYAFVSKWLSEECGNLPYVPHIVKEVPLNRIRELGHIFREEYDIPLDAKAFGRLGGYNEFNLEFVHKAIENALNRDPKLFFIFCNTKEFLIHPRVLYFSGVYDMEEKYSFIGACDAMIHARRRGETFGLAIAEFSSCNKPVFTWEGPYEKAHIQMLGDKGVYYKDGTDLENLLLDYKIEEQGEYNAYKDYNPENVIKTFEQVFLK